MKDFDFTPYLEYLKQPITYYVIGGLGLVLLVLIIVSSSKIKKLRKLVDDYNYEYNSLKSIPLLFKLNKAGALAKISNELREIVELAKTEFDDIQQNLDQVNEILRDTEDLLVLGKNSKAKKRVSDIEELFDKTRIKVSNLDRKLDEIVEQESQLRLRINNLKDTFQDLKLAVNSDVDKYAHCIEIVDENLAEIEGKFTEFENTILASKFAEAATIMEGISQGIINLSNIINRSPALVEKAKYELPDLVERVREAYLQAVDDGCTFVGVPIEDTLQEILDGVKGASGEIRGGRIVEIEENFKRYYQQLDVLVESVNKEHQSLKEMKQLSAGIYNTLETTENKIGLAAELSERIKSRLKESVNTQEMRQYPKTLEVLRRQMSNLEEEYKEKKALTSGILLRMKELELNINQFNGLLDTAIAQLKNKLQDEDDAKTKLIKLNILINDVLAMVQRRNLPSLPEGYQNQLSAARGKVKAVEDILLAAELDVSALNIVTVDAWDFITAFHNDIRELIRKTELAEGAIVLCNRYRAMFSDIDSDLTKAELWFNEGEYQASLDLSLPIAARMFPENYDELIREFGEK